MVDGAERRVGTTSAKAGVRGDLRSLLRRTVSARNEVSAVAARQGPEAVHLRTAGVEGWKFIARAGTDGVKTRFETAVPCFARDDKQKRGLERPR